MPPQPADLPDFWIIDKDDHNKICCSICVSQFPKKAWIARRNRSYHVKSQFHQRCVDMRRMGAIEKDMMQWEMEQAEQEAEPTPLNLGSADSFPDQSVQYFNMGTLTDGPYNDEVIMEDEHVPMTAEEEDEFIRQHSADIIWTDDFDEIEHNESQTDEQIETEKYFVEKRADLSEWDENKDNWFPYPSKTVFLIDLLNNLPRLRLSRQQMELILWIMRECGAINVPTINQLRTITKRIHRQVCGVSTTRVHSSLGNVFYVNNIRELIARDVASPHTAPLLEYYPVTPETTFSETWHARKIHELDPSLLTPMARQGFKDFYVKELAQLVDETLVIPTRWFKRSGELWADAYNVSNTEDGLVVHSNAQISVPLSKFVLNWLDLQDDPNLHWTDESIWFRQQMPNALRTIAGGEELYTVFINVWADDVSGNVSKQMNPHKNIYITNASLPGRLLQQEFHIKFVSTSQHASTAEQMEAIREIVNATNKQPHRVYNAHTRRHVRIRIAVAALPCDNPQGSEESSHIGPQGNCKCRKCYVGGAAQEIEKDENYDALHRVGRLRTAEETLAQVSLQLDLAAEGVAQPIKDLQTRTGVKDKVTQGWILKSLQKYQELRQNDPRLSTIELKSAVKNWVSKQTTEPFNPLLNLKGVDPHRDTPLELLHTMLLGIVKYFWHNQNQLWKDDDRERIAVSLRSLSVNGLGISTVPASYIVQYRNNLIGKHFRILMQLLIFACHSLLDQAHLTLLAAIGKLGAMFWMTEIYDLQTYLASIDLNICIANVLDAFDQVDGGRIIDKQKMHLLVHAADDVLYHGPLVRSETETFECYNHVFRLCSILSNRQAPSKDIAVKFAKMESTKHIVSGGYWMTDDDDDHWAQAGRGIQHIFNEHSIIQHHLGWIRHDNKPAGTFQSHHKKQKSQTWEVWNDKGYQLPGTYCVQPDSSWSMFQSTIAQSQDICKADSWEQISIGRIMHLLGSLTSPNDRLILLSCFDVSDTLHSIYQIPILRLSHTHPYIAIIPTNILFLINVQHDCCSSQCKPTHTRAITQERETTNRTIKVIEHADNNQYVLNTYALHNYHRLCQIPSIYLLLRPRPLHDDRQDFHNKIAAQIRETRNARRAKSAAQRKAKSQKQPVPKPALSAGYKRRRQELHVASTSRTTDQEIEQEEDGGNILAPDSEDERFLKQAWSDGGGDSQDEAGLSSDDPEQALQIRSRRTRKIIKPRRYQN